MLFTKTRFCCFLLEVCVGGDKRNYTLTVRVIIGLYSENGGSKELRSKRSSKMCSKMCSKCSKCSKTSLVRVSRGTQCTQSTHSNIGQNTANSGLLTKHESTVKVM